MLKFEICHIIVDEEILDEDDLEFENNFEVDTVQMRKIEIHEKLILK